MGCAQGLAQSTTALSNPDAFAELNKLLVEKNPADLQYQILTESGKTQFRMGETINLILRFTSTASNKYQVVRKNGIPISATILKDYVHTDPAGGGANPRANFSPTILPGGYSGGGPFVTIWNAPVNLPTELNEDWRFDKPGKYRIFLQSPRLLPVGARGPASIRGAEMVCSNIIELEILPPNPVWIQTQFAAAKSMLNDAKTLDTVRLDAIRVLKNLQTEEAAQVLIAAMGETRFDRRFTTPMRDALFQSRYREFVLEGLRKLASDPQTCTPAITDALEVIKETPK